LAVEPHYTVTNIIKVNSASLDGEALALDYTYNPASEDMRAGLVWPNDETFLQDANSPTTIEASIDNLIQTVIVNGSVDRPAFVAMTGKTYRVTVIVEEVTV